MIRANPETVRLLFVGIVANAVGDLLDWSARWERWRDRSGPAEFARRLRLAVMADAWLTSDDPGHADGQRFTFAECCEALDLSLERCLEPLYRMIDPAALQVLWNETAAAQAIAENRAAGRRRKAEKARPAAASEPPADPAAYEGCSCDST